MRARRTGITLGRGRLPGEKLQPAPNWNWGIPNGRQGESYLAAELSRQAILKYLEDPRAFFSELTPRQGEVLKMIAEGHATKEIARSLNISGKTVETHRAQIMERLNIHEVAGLVRYALRMVW